MIPMDFCPSCRSYRPNGGKTRFGISQEGSKTDWRPLGHLESVTQRPRMLVSSAMKDLCLGRGNSKTSFKSSGIPCTEPGFMPEHLPPS